MKKIPGKGRVTPGPAWSNCSFWAEPAHLSPPTVPSEPTLTETNIELEHHVPKPRAEFSARKNFYLPSRTIDRVYVTTLNLKINQVFCLLKLAKPDI